MKLVVFGDSWAYGAELEDRHHTNYAYHLKKLLGCDEVDNRSFAGCSNHSIIREFLQWVKEGNTQDTFVIIGWTSPERIDVFPDKSVLSPDDIQEWRTLGPWIFYKNVIENNYPIDPKYQEHLEFAYANLRTQYSCYVEWINQVILVQNMLENLNIKHHMHQAITFGHKWPANSRDRVGKDSIQHQHGSINTNDMWDMINDDCFLSKDMSLYDLLGSNARYWDHMSQHPNVEGHETIAQLLHNDIKVKNLI